MAYEIVLGRSAADKERFGLAGSVLIGKQYVKMGASTSLSQSVFLDVNKAHVVFVCGKRGCLNGDTKISTNNGFKNISKFNSKTDKVWSFDTKNKRFEWSNALLVKYPVLSNEKLVKIELYDGQTLTMTSEHPLLIENNSKFIWRKAKDMKIDDSIVCTSYIPETTKNNSSLRIARLLGFILADGNINIRQGRWKDGRGYFYNGTRKRVRIFNNTPQVLLQAQKDFDEEFNIKSKRYKRNDCNCEVIQTQHQHIVNKIVQLGVNAGNKANIIRVPEVIWTGSNDVKAAFLKAAFSCDGFVSKNQNGRRIMYYSNSRGFIEDLQLLLLHFNIQSRIREKKTSCNNKRFISHLLDITDYKSLQIWKDNISFFDEEKNKRINSFTFWRMPQRKKTKYWETNLYSNTIKTISFVEGIKEVYDLHVPGNHSFIANGTISHNSGKSYTLGVIAEGIAQLEPEVRDRLSVLMLDTMGIYWTMKYPNNPDNDLLKEWNLEGKGLPIVIFCPKGLFADYKAKGIPADVPFSIRPSELGPDDWNSTFELSTNDPIAVFIERTILELKKERDEYSIRDIIESLNADKSERDEIVNAAVNRFKAADSWGIFAEESTPIKELAFPGRIAVLDLSAYMTMPNGWKIKHLVMGLVCKSLFQERMLVRKSEEFESVHSALHFIKVSEDEEKLRGKEMPVVWIMVDEAHEFLPRDEKTSATDALVTLLREGRQPGIALVLATQQPGKIHTDAMTQSDVILSHRLTARIDTDALAGLMQSYLRKGLDVQLDSLPKVPGACIAVDDVAERMYPLRIRPRFSWHGGSAPDILKEEVKKEKNNLFGF